MNVEERLEIANFMMENDMLKNGVEYIKVCHGNEYTNLIDKLNGLNGLYEYRKGQTDLGFTGYDEESYQELEDKISAVKIKIGQYLLK